MSRTLPYQHSAARFAIVGCANFVVSFGVFYASYNYLPDGLRLNMPAAAVANVLAYAAGMINSFMLNRIWTFRAGGNATVQAFRFAIVNMLSLAVSTSAMFHFVDVLHYPEIAVWIPATMVAILMNYFGCKHWAFATPALQSTNSG